MKDYALYLLSFFITIFTLWWFIAESPSKFDSLSGDEQYWLDDFSKNSFFSYIYKIDFQNPYLSLLPRIITSVGFKLGGMDFVGSFGMLLVRLTTFSILAICISFPLFPPVRKMLGIRFYDGILFWLLILSVTNPENIYVINFSYYLFVPILLIIIKMNRTPSNLHAVSNIKSIWIGSYFFIATFFLVNKALIAVTLFVGVLSLLCINLQTNKLPKKLESTKIICTLFASFILLLMTKSEDASVGYSLLTFLWAVSGVFFAIGSFLLPLVAVSFDTFARHYDLDYLIAAGKLLIFLFGLLSFLVVVKVLRNHFSYLSAVKKEKNELLVVTIMLSTSIFVLSYSQYSAWYLSNWLIAPANTLFVRHFILPQVCLIFLLIILSKILIKFERESSSGGGLTRIAFKVTKQIPLIITLQVLCNWLLKFFYY